MRFGENVLGPKYIDIYQFLGGGCGGGCCGYYLHTILAGSYSGLIICLAAL